RGRRRARRRAGGPGRGGRAGGPPRRGGRRGPRRHLRRPRRAPVARGRPGAEDPVGADAAPAAPAHRLERRHGRRRGPGHRLGQGRRGGARLGGRDPPHPGLRGRTDGRRNRRRRRLRRAAERRVRVPGAVGRTRRTGHHDAHPRAAARRRAAAVGAPGDAPGLDARDRRPVLPLGAQGDRHADAHRVREGTRDRQPRRPADLRRRRLGADPPRRRPARRPSVRRGPDQGGVGGVGAEVPAGARADHLGPRPDRPGTL
ncbi:MAG: hypothetical protein AVDCRST_MAG79-1643, partial [uncultured Thermoleophilia bacterium]